MYVPENIPSISQAMLLSWKNHSFSMICSEILHFFTDLDVATLNDMTSRAYSTFNDGHDVLPMTVVNDVILLDASCGPTLAFKDIGQQIVAQLMNHYLSLRNEKAIIMVDTSGLPATYCADVLIYDVHALQATPVRPPLPQSRAVPTWTSPSSIPTR